jgi:NAD(P)-dependent dehydrogenase (short-subunit alcohol dehydrogenase family)
VHASLPYLREQRHGRILVTTSSAALYGDAGFVTYATAKAALIGFVKALALESASAGITANAVLPFARTPMTETLFDDGPFSRAGEAMGVRSVADLVVWLAGPTCTETGRVLIAGGTEFRVAEMVVGPGVRLAPGTRSPEALAARAGEILALDGARAFPTGAALLDDLAEQAATYKPGA